MKKLTPLQENSLWYKYKVPIWNNKESPESQVIHNIMRVLRCIRNHGPLAYISIPITSGKTFYEFKKKYPEKEDSELVQYVIQENYRMGWRMVEDVMRRRKCPVLYPADLIPIYQKWEQIHFQALWLSAIAEKCTEMHMFKDWQYSNGAAEEFTHTFQLKLGLMLHPSTLFYNTKDGEVEARNRMENIEVFNDRGKPISIYHGIELIEDAISWIKNEGFSADRLENCLKVLKWTEEKLEEGYYENNWNK